MKLCLILPLAAALAGCPPHPSPPPNDADAAPSRFDAASHDASLGAGRCCANLRMLGCASPESGPRCEERIDMIVEDRLTKFDVECCAGAKTVDDVRKCPAVVCEK